MIVALDAGHSLITKGKEAPDGTKEWVFNNEVVCAIEKYLRKHKITTIRLDDPSGKSEVSLQNRVERANGSKATILISCHHNAVTGSFGTWTGIETYVLKPKVHYKKALLLAKVVHPRIVQAMQLKDRGIKEAAFYMLKYSNMPAILIEGGFMDSVTDFPKLKNKKNLQAQGIAIAEGVMTYLYNQK